MKVSIKVKAGGLAAMAKAIGGRGGSGRRGGSGISAPGGGAGGAGDNGLSGPEMDAMRKQWTIRYSAFIRKRFSTYSRGGGDWPPLALSTIKARRGPDKKRAARRARNGVASGSTRARDTARGSKIVEVAGRSVSILQDTGVMARALNIGQTGNYNAATPWGIEFGFAGVQHSPGESASIAQIAMHHNEGGKHLPKREILVQPDQATAVSMSRDLLRAIMATAARGQAQ